MADNRLFFFLCFLLGLTVALATAACSSTAAPPSPTPQTISAATVTPPPATAPTMTTVSTARPRPSPTIVPTATAVPTQTGAPPETTALTATATLPPTATPDFIATFEAIGPPVELGRYPSPAGDAVAETFRFECTLLPTPESDDSVPYEQAYEWFQLVGASGEMTIFADQLQSCGGLGAAGLQGYFWSEDGRYFYYGTAREGVPDGCGYFAPPYYRLDVTDMTTRYLGYGSLSPDGTMLALWSADDALVVYTISGEELVRVPVSGANRVQNSIAWSPDGRSLAYVLTSDYCPEGASTLVRLDLPELEPNVLREDDPGYAYVNWLDNERLELSNVFGDSMLVIRAADGEPVP